MSIHAGTPPPRRDPRDIITPDALSVAPELIGLPLARPWRRATALAIDGLLVAVLANAPGVLLGVAAALVLFRVSARPAPGAGYIRRSVRLGFRFGGAVMLFVTVVSGWDSVTDRVEKTVKTAMTDEAPARPTEPDNQELRLDGMAGLRAAGSVMSFRKAPDEATARTSADQVVRALRDEGIPEEEIREGMLSLAESAPDRPWLRAAADSALGALREPSVASDAPSPDSLVAALAAALRAGDGRGAEDLRPQLVLALAADTLGELGEELRELREQRGELRARVDALEDRGENHPGVLARARSLVEDDLGLGLGWMGLYFTATVALFRGRTPGKRLLGIRIIQLNGKPIGWWIAFERFGGYAAGVATGLLGFAQIYWDRNRQAIHDKITETAVIRG